MIPDYSQGGENWLLPETLNINQQTPIDVPEEDYLEYEDKVELMLKYEEINNISLESALWTVKLSAPSHGSLGSLFAYDLNG